MDRTKLKDLVNRIENWAEDGDKLAQYLNSTKFIEEVYVPPAKPYPTVEASMSRVLELLTNFADNNFKVLRKIEKTSFASHPPLIDPSSYVPLLQQDGLLDLMSSWLLLFGENLKSMLTLYGKTPLPPPDAPHPGAEQQDQLCAEIVAWLTKITSSMKPFGDGQNVGGIVGPGGAKGSNDTLDTLLVEIEQQFHRIAQDYAQIADRLPYHLLHGAGKP